MTPTQIAAHAYVDRGWYVVPLYPPTDGVCACPGGSECDKPAKHPLRGCKWGAHPVTDHDTVDAWWKSYPSANVGIVTGHAFDVLDIDGQTGSDALTGLAIEARALFPDCWGWGPMARTFKGYHLFYASTGSKTSIGFLPQVDWKARGSYVVAPPSLHVIGHVYEWMPDCGMGSPLPFPPDFVIERVSKRLLPDRPAVLDTPSNQCAELQAFNPMGLLRTVEEANEGNRNNALNWAGWKLGGEYQYGRITREDALRVGEALVTVAIRNGLREGSSRATVASGFRKGCGK